MKRMFKSNFQYSTDGSCFRDLGSFCPKLVIDRSYPTYMKKNPPTDLIHHPHFWRKSLLPCWPCWLIHLPSECLL